MAKKNRIPQPATVEPQPQAVSSRVEMTLQEAKAWRASLHKPAPKVLTEVQKREAFRIYWASQKAKYGKGKALEKSLWLHLRAINMDTPEKFEDGINNFGFKKVK